MDRFKQYLQDHLDDLDTDRPRDKVWQHIQQQVQAPEKRKAIIRPLHLRWAAAACVTGLLAVAAWWLISSLQTDKSGDSTAKTPLPALHQDSPLINTGAHPQTASAGTAIINDLPKSRQPQTADNENREIAASGPERERAISRPDSEIRESYQPSPLQHMEAGFIHIINSQLKQIRATPLYAENADYFSTFKKQFYQLNEDEKAWKKRVGSGTVNEEQLDELINIYEQKLKVLRLLQAEIIKTNKHYRQTGSAVAAHNSYMDI
jgi:hypothetical protein